MRKAQVHGGNSGRCKSQRILRNDAQIRILAEPWLAQFDHVLEGQPQVLH